ADTQIADVEPAGGEILAERAVEDGVTAPLQLVDDLGGDDQHRLARPAMKLGVVVQVALHAEGVEDAERDRAFRKAAGGDVELENGSVHGGRLNQATDEHR